MGQFLNAWLYRGHSNSHMAETAMHPNWVYERERSKSRIGRVYDSPFVCVVAILLRCVFFASIFAKSVPSSGTIRLFDFIHLLALSTLNQGVPLYTIYRRDEFSADAPHRSSQPELKSEKYTRAFFSDSHLCCLFFCFLSISLPFLRTHWIVAVFRCDLDNDNRIRIGISDNDRRFARQRVSHKFG